jgi:hypothetical protein
MSNTRTSPETSRVAPEVRLFLARVRHELADLDAEEVSEMTDGLEADLTELVAERGAAALGSPVEYADELRAAAGVEPQVRRPRAHLPFGERLTGWLDAGHARFDGLVAALPGDASDLLVALRPVWWVARAWIAVVAGVGLLKDSAGLSSPYYAPALVPHMRGLGWPLLAVAVIVSVQLGRGRIWPGGSRGVGARVVLLVLNVLALVMLPVALASVRNEPEQSYWQGYQDAEAVAVPTVDGPGYGIDENAGVYSSGRWVTNIYPYDASGKPLVGVQLFDQLGKPIDIVAAPECPDEVGGWSVNPVEQDPNCWNPDGSGRTTKGRVPYPWTNGATQLENVFPLPSRMQEDLNRTGTAFTETDPPRIGQLPLASVPAVSLPGIVPSTQAPAKPAK